MKRKTSGKFIITLLIFVLLSININMIGVTVAQETHDVAVVSVTPYPNMAGLGLDDLVDLTVVVENQGTENENFTVTVSYGNETIQPTIIETQNVTNQASNTNKTLTFTWNTTDVTVGRYFFNATASFVSNETDTVDNTFISPSDIATITTNTVAVVSPYITVLPRHTVDPTLTLGKNYTVSIYTNYNGSDIWGYQFVLTYNPLVLEGVEVVNGDLITEGDVTFTAGAFNNTIGKLELTTANSLNKTAFPYPPLNNTGPGVLAYVTFTIVGEGDSNIKFLIGASGASSALKSVDGSNIVDYLTDLELDPTSGKILHGYFSNTAGPVTHDVAVISLDFSPNNVTAGEIVTINVTIQNKGTVTEEVSVTVYWGFAIDHPLHPIGDPETVTLGSGEYKTMTFTWDTTEVTTGTHPLTAVVDYSFGGIEDANPVDNMLKIDDAVTVKTSLGTPLPIDLIIIIVVVAIAALIVIYIVIRKIRK
jgi:hypothetical protein